MKSFAVSREKAAMNFGENDNASDELVLSIAVTAGNCAS